MHIFVWKSWYGLIIFLGRLTPTKQVSIVVICFAWYRKPCTVHPCVHRHFKKINSCSNGESVVGFLTLNLVYVTWIISLYFFFNVMCVFLINEVYFSLYCVYFILCKRKKNGRRHQKFWCQRIPLKCGVMGFLVPWSFLLTWQQKIPTAPERRHHCTQCSKGVYRYFHPHLILSVGKTSPISVK